MQRLLDVLASGVHDTKNQLFLAESLIAAAEAQHGLDLSEARYAIEAAAGRLSRTLSAYHLLREDATLSMVPCVIADLCDEVVLAQKRHLAHAGIALEIACSIIDEWVLDRDLVTDILNNAVQNAGRFARSRIRLEAKLDDGWLVFVVADDGPGYARDAGGEIRRGTGLIVAERIARLHERHDPLRHGTLGLANDGPLGGAVLELRLP